MHRIDKLSSRYSTASFFLSLLLAVSVALILQRHIELERALDDKANSTQMVLDLSTKDRKWGEKQLTELAELKECQTDRNKQLADIIADERDRRVKCADHLNSLHEKSDSLLKSSQALVVEKEKCSHRLTILQHSLTTCETNLAACEKY